MEIILRILTAILFVLSPYLEAQSLCASYFFSLQPKSGYMENSSHDNSLTTFVHVVDLIQKIPNEGWDNLGIYIVRSPHVEVPIVAKLTAYQSDFLTISQMAHTVSMSTSYSTKYYGVADIQLQKGHTQKAYLSEYVEGIVSKDSKVVSNIRNITMRQVETAFRELLQADVLPLDFQFIVQKDGSIKIIDTDLYQSRNTLQNNAQIRDGYATPRGEVERFLDKTRDPLQGDMIWGVDVFNKLPTDIKERSIQLMREFHRKAQELLER